MRTRRRDVAVLGDSPDYDDHEFQQDFDEHGTLVPDHYMEGIGGDYFVFRHNTFLGTNRLSIMARGTSCRFTKYINNRLPTASAWETSTATVSRTRSWVPA